MSNTATSTLDEVLKDEFSSSINTVAEPERETDENPFPVKALPKVLADMATMVTGYLKVPIGMVAPAILAVAGAALGKGVVTESKQNRYTRANLSVIIGAPSGTGKSELMRLVMEAFLSVERALRDKFNREKKPFLEAERARLEQVLKRAGSKRRGDATSYDVEQMEAARRLEEIKTEMVQPRLTMCESTPEKIVRVVSEQGETIFIAVSEGRPFVDILMGRYRSGGKGTDEGPYLFLYTGERYIVDRIHNGTVILESPCGTVLLMVQPDLLDAMFANEGLRTGGYLQRGLVVDCHMPRQRREVVEPPFDHGVADAYNATIESLIYDFRLRKGDPLVIQPDDDALAVMREFHNTKVIDASYDDVATFAMRWEEQGWRMATMIHVVEHGTDAHKFKLSGKTAQRALDLSWWFAQQQLRLLESGREKQREKKTADVIDVIAKRFAKTHEPVRARDVMQYGHLDRDTTNQLLDELVTKGQLEEFTVKPKSGPSYKTYAPTTK